MNLDSDIDFLAQRMIAQRQESGWRRAVVDSWLITGRNLIRLKRNPIVIVAIAIFPTVFLAGFWIIGQKLMARQGIDYIQYLVPIINIQVLFFAGLGSSIMLAKDIETGMMNRCRVMPISRVAVVAGLVMAYMVRALIATVILFCVAYGFGFRFYGGLFAWIGYFTLIITFTATCITGYTILALKLRDPTLVDAVSIIPYTPLLLLSNGFSPTENFPSWLQPFVRYQPVSITSDALRSLLNGDASLALFIASMAWLLGLLIVLGAWSVRLYKRLS
ncbi:ABC transporter permease [cf. Phormidesmis sp. LEGE 11477]|uniref:ABC transporter permease n=1 Tax=cf. Phormidesmis sp. LEGE 11477 TaxID=1828680 RepID=UPI00187EDEDF|nr:ABC transporter permease [cf. Phormidesmis sp. LEGE 11477]MBE9059767.1 ABC transporter permease [cf. Phormidesmis sp. LEGE 11477]